MGDLQAAMQHCLSITAASFTGENQFQLKPHPGKTGSGFWAEKQAEIANDSFNISC